MRATEELENKLKKVADRNQGAAMRLPLISKFVEDIIFVFESILICLKSLEDRIEKLENKKQG